MSIRFSLEGDRPFRSSHSEYFKDSTKLNLNFDTFLISGNVYLFRL